MQLVRMPGNFYQSSQLLSFSAIRIIWVSPRATVSFWQSGEDLPAWASENSCISNSSSIMYGLIHGGRYDLFKFTIADEDESDPVSKQVNHEKATSLTVVSLHLRVQRPTAR